MPATRLRLAVTAVLLGATVLGGATWPDAARAVPAVAAPQSFAELVERVGPAVVNISAVRSGSPATPGAPVGPEELLRRYFGGEPEARPRAALGSGFIIDPAGYVVTNNHVIDKADQLAVTLRDGTRLDARLVGRDAKTDLALLKVEAPQPLPAVEFGDSDALRVGDWVVAVGNPFGLGGSVTAGILSARGRDIHSGPYDDYLQIDAPINQGNSGGPTFDMQGRVVGINTAIFSPNGGSVGIGFAIPANLAKRVVADLRDHGRVERGWLGVQIQEVTPEIAESLGLSEAKGALVAQIVPDGPAARAGLRNGDVIRGVGGDPVESPRDLSRRVAETPAGSPVELELWRRGRTETVRANLARLDDEKAATVVPASADAPAEVLGMRLAPLDARTRERLGLPPGTEGVAVVGVEPGRGAELPVQAGDVIVEVAQRPVDRPGDVADAVREARAEGRRSVLARVSRDGNERYVALALPPAQG